MTKRIRLLVSATVLAGIAAATVYSARYDLEPFVTRMLASEYAWFRMTKPPKPEILQLFDMGVVDVDGDGRLDLYTSNHNYRQYLWLSDSRGNYRDVSWSWGMAQAEGMPGWEQSEDLPALDKPGLYIHWQQDTLHLRAHRIGEVAPVAATLELYSPVRIMANDGFAVETTAFEPPRAGKVHHTATKIAARGDGHLVLFITSRGAPFTFRIEPSFPLDRVYMGSNAVSPKQHVYTLALRDRHGMAWLDINNDGRLDVFVNRGAIGGTLRFFPESVRASVRDEFLVSTPQGGYRDVAKDWGFEKQDCSARHAKWVSLRPAAAPDLFINCQDRGIAEGRFPKQLYRRMDSARYIEVAAQLGLDMSDRQLVDLAWFDVDDDGDIDLFTHEDTGYFLYRNTIGTFQREPVHRAKFQRADVPGLRHNTFDYWQFDGKLSLADFDADGDLDVFIASKQGNVLLRNESGKFRPVDPASLGLPGESVAAAWVDYDNDGFMDLHLVPHGLFRQRSGGRFEETGLLTTAALKYQAAIPLWYDRDNDGDRDLLMALQDNATLWRWWEKPFKSKDERNGRDDRFRWKMRAYENVGARNHWLQLDLVGDEINRQAIGARVTVVTPSSRHGQEVGAHDGAYLSQGHYRLYFGLGGHAQAQEIHIRWPDGTQQILRDVPADQRLSVEKGR